MECYALLAGRDCTWEPWDMSCIMMEAMRSGTRLIVAPTGGLKNIAEDGFTDLWTDGKMTVEALVEQEFLKKVTLAKNSKLGCL